MPSNFGQWDDAHAQCPIPSTWYLLTYESFVLNFHMLARHRWQRQPNNGIYYDAKSKAEKKNDKKQIRTRETRKNSTRIHEIHNNKFKSKHTHRVRRDAHTWAILLNNNIMICMLDSAVEWFRLCQRDHNSCRHTHTHTLDEWMSRCDEDSLAVYLCFSWVHFFRFSRLCCGVNEQWSGGWVLLIQCAMWSPKNRIAQKYYVGNAAVGHSSALLNRHHHHHPFILLHLFTRTIMWPDKCERKVNNTQTHITTDILLAIQKQFYIMKLPHMTDETICVSVGCGQPIGDDMEIESFFVVGFFVFFFYFSIQHSSMSFL